MNQLFLANLKKSKEKLYAEAKSNYYNPPTSLGNVAKLKNAADLKNTDELKNAADLKNTDELKNAADLKNVTKLENTDELKNAADLKNVDELKNTDELKNAADLKNTIDLKNTAELKNNDQSIGYWANVATVPVNINFSSPVVCDSCNFSMDEFFVCNCYRDFIICPACKNPEESKKEFGEFTRKVKFNPNSSIDHQSLCINTHAFYHKQRVDKICCNICRTQECDTIYRCILKDHGGNGVLEKSEKSKQDFYSSLLYHDRYIDKSRTERINEDCDFDICELCLCLVDLLSPFLLSKWLCLIVHEYLIEYQTSTERFIDTIEERDNRSSGKNDKDSDDNKDNNDNNDNKDDEGDKDNNGDGKINGDGKTNYNKNNNKNGKDCKDNKNNSDNENNYISNKIGVMDKINVIDKNNVIEYRAHKLVKLPAKMSREERIIFCKDYDMNYDEESELRNIANKYFENKNDDDDNNDNNDNNDNSNNNKYRVKINLIPEPKSTLFFASVKLFWLGLPNAETLYRWIVNIIERKLIPLLAANVKDELKEGVCLEEIFLSSNYEEINDSRDILNAATDRINNEIMSAAKGSKGKLLLWSEILAKVRVRIDWHGVEHGICIKARHNS